MRCEKKFMHKLSIVWFPVRDKSIVVLVHAMKAERGIRSTCIASPILNISTRWRWVVDWTPQLLYTWERTVIPFKWGGWVGPGAGPNIMVKRKISCPMIVSKTATLCNKSHQTFSVQDICLCEIAQDIKIKAFIRNAGQSSGNSCANCAFHKSCYGSSWTSNTILKTRSLDSPICHAITHVLLHASCFTAAVMTPSLANVCTVCWQHAFTSALNVQLHVSWRCCHYWTC